MANKLLLQLADHLEGTAPTVRAIARKELEKRLTELLSSYRIPQDTTDIIVALIRQAMS